MDSWSVEAYKKDDAKQILKFEINERIGNPVS